MMLHMNLSLYLYPQCAWLMVLSLSSDNGEVVEVLVSWEKGCESKRRSKESVQTSLFSTYGNTQGTGMDGIPLKWYINLQVSCHCIFPFFLSLHGKNKHRLGKFTRNHLKASFFQSRRGERTLFWLFMLVSFMFHVQEGVHSTTSASALVEN